jgi:hypothetical protein
VNHAPVIQPQPACDKDGQHQSDTRAALVGVYLPRTPSGCPPDRYMEREDARYQVAIGEAETISRGKAIRLLNARRCDPNDSDFRGRSCRPGTGMHDRGARAIVQAREAQETTLS